MTGGWNHLVSDPSDQKISWFISFGWRKEGRREDSYFRRLEVGISWLVTRQIRRLVDWFHTSRLSHWMTQGGDSGGHSSWMDCGTAATCTFHSTSPRRYHIYRYCLLKTEVGRNRYQLIQFYELSGRQVSFSGPQWTPSREQHKRFQRLYYILTPC